MLQACLNGGRGRRAAGSVPITAAELAADSVLVRRAGADALHVHPRNAHGEESLEPDDVADTLTAIREAVPGMPVGIGTGAWIAPGGRERHQPMMNWTVQPDYVSINIGEDDAPEVMAMMAERGVGIEAGIWSAEEAERYLSLVGRPAPLRILVEMPDAETHVALAEANRTLAVLAREAAPILLHGFQRSAWACVEEARKRGLSTRIGFEDVLELPDGSPAPGNVELVRAARAIMAGHDAPSP